MLQAVLQMPEKVIFREIKRPVSAPGQVLIKVERIGIAVPIFTLITESIPISSAPLSRATSFPA